VKIAILPGDGIGTEIVAQAVRVLGALDLRFETETALVGGAAYDAHGHPLPEATLKLAQGADAVLFGAVGDWKYDKLERALRPEQAILKLRKDYERKAGAAFSLQEFHDRFIKAGSPPVKIVRRELMGRDGPLL